MATTKSKELVLKPSPVEGKGNALDYETPFGTIRATYNGWDSEGRIYVRLEGVAHINNVEYKVSVSADYRQRTYGEGSTWTWSCYQGVEKANAEWDKRHITPGAQAKVEPVITAILEDFATHEEVKTAWVAWKRADLKALARLKVNEAAKVYRAYLDFWQGIDDASDPVAAWAATCKITKG